MSSGASARAYSPREENACVDEKARREVEAKKVEEARRQKNADAEARASAHYANGSSCTRTASVDAGSCGAGAPTRRSIELTNRAEADRKRIDALVRPNETFDKRLDIEKEVVRLRALAPAKNDAALQGAVRARVAWLTEHWCALSRKAGDNPPAASFNPYTASDEELHNALLWTTLGGVVPHEALAFDGGAHFREDILEAVALRTPGLGEEVLASYASEPATQRMLVERELRRLGDRTQCRADETNEDLVARRTRLLLSRHADGLEAAQNEHQIGLDGVQGTARRLVEYELEQRVLAMNPGTTLGGVAAGVAAANGATTEEIRAAGAVGNAVEGIGGALAGVDARKIKNQGEAKATTAGARRPPGPGLGRRTRVATSSDPTARARTPNGWNDKHVMNGDVGDVAGGFHHQAPGTESNARIVRGTETKPNKFGVYSANVEVRNPVTGEWVRKRPISTFFPRHWTRAEVRDAILYAFEHRQPTNESGVWHGRLPKGMVIKMIVSSENRLISTYPLDERSSDQD